MKVYIVVLVLSLGLNMALLTRSPRQPTPAGAASAALAETVPQAASVAPLTAPGARAEATGRAGASLWSKLYSPDLRTFVARLRTAGFPPSVLRAIVDAEVDRRFSSRTAELRRELKETPYWKAHGHPAGDVRILEQISQLYRERAQLRRELLGIDAYAAPGIDSTTAHARQFGTLPVDKVALIQRIDDDYSEMSGQIRASMRGVVLPEDRAKLDLLEREKRADLAAVLSPAELAEYEMRNSAITSRVRPAVTIIDANEAEFRAIYAAYDAHKQLFFPPSAGVGGTTLNVAQQRHAAMDQIFAELRTSLGEDRAAQFQRASDPDFQYLYWLGQSERVPYDQLVRAFDVRAPATDAALRIIDSRTMTAEERRTAMTAVIMDAREKVTSALGPAVARTYIESARWMCDLNQGRVITLSIDGFTSARGLSASVGFRPPPPP